MTATQKYTYSLFAEAGLDVTGCDDESRCFWVDVSPPCLIFVEDDSFTFSKMVAGLRCKRH